MDSNKFRINWCWQQETYITKIISKARTKIDKNCI